MDRRKLCSNCVESFNTSTETNKISLEVLDHPQSFSSSTLVETFSLDTCVSINSLSFLENSFSQSIDQPFAYVVSTVNPKKRKRKQKKLMLMTLKQKNWIAELYSNNPSFTQKKLIEKFENNFGFKPSQSAVSRALKVTRDENNSNSEVKKVIQVNYPNMDRALYDWFLENQETVNISGEILKENGRQFLNKIYPDAQMEFSNGWLSRFKKRYNIKRFRRHGESGSVDLLAIQQNLPNIQQQLSKFSLNDIFNMDETGLFYRLSGDLCLSTKQLEGKVQSKQRLSIAICCNADGSEKLEIWVIGKYQNPRCLKNINRNQLGVIYRANSNAWMTTFLFHEWIQWFDRKMFGRKVALILDNCPSHKLNGIELENVTIIFLPPNVTSKIQPCDAGIIRTFKACYRKRFIRAILDGYEQKQGEPEKINILNAIYHIRSAWHLDIKPSTIKNCFRHSQLIKFTTSPQETTFDMEPFDQLISVMEDIQSDMKELNYNNPMDINKFIEYEDKELYSTEQITDDTILSRWMPTNIDKTIEYDDSESDNDNNENNESNAAPITSFDAFQHLNELKKYWLQCGDSSDLNILKSLEDIRIMIEQRRIKSLKQATINDFFFKKSEEKL